MKHKRPKNFLNSSDEGTHEAFKKLYKRAGFSVSEILHGYMHNIVLFSRARDLDDQPGYANKEQCLSGWYRALQIDFISIEKYVFF